MAYKEIYHNLNSNSMNSQLLPIGLHLVMYNVPILLFILNLLYYIILYVNVS